MTLYAVTRRRPVVIRQCVYCGRTGTRQFVHIGRGGWMCKAKTTCDRRRARFNRGFKT